MSKIAQGEDGKITGLDEQLGKLKTSKPFLFKSDEPQKKLNRSVNLADFVMM